MAKWNAKEKCDCQPNLGEVCSICNPPANTRIVQDKTDTTLRKILQEIESLERSEPSSYFTDAHIDGYNHALSDLKAIVKFEISFGDKCEWCSGIMQSNLDCPNCHEKR